MQAAQEDRGGTAAAAVWGGNLMSIGTIKTGGQLVIYNNKIIMLNFHKLEGKKLMEMAWGGGACGCHYQGWGLLCRNLWEEGDGFSCSWRPMVFKGFHSLLCLHRAQSWFHLEHDWVRRQIFRMQQFALHLIKIKIIRKGQGTWIRFFKSGVGQIKKQFTEKYHPKCFSRNWYHNIISWLR